MKCFEFCTNNLKINRRKRQVERECFFNEFTVMWPRKKKLIKLKIIIINRLLFINLTSTDYYGTFAEIFRTRTGASHLFYDGHIFGKKCENRNGYVWRCTKQCTSGKRGNCNAIVHTRLINGYAMVRAVNVLHTCEKMSDTEFKNIKYDKKYKLNGQYDYC